VFLLENLTQETGQYLIHALDDDRLSERKLFPLEKRFSSHVTPSGVE
jgi:hypothetical protein